MRESGDGGMQLDAANNFPARIFALLSSYSDIELLAVIAASLGAAKMQ
jgi:hypothetical protein